MEKVKLDTIIRTIVLALALVNQVLTISGHSIIPISDEQVSETVSAVFTICAALWSWWKNNSFTQAALKADKVYEELKQEAGK